MIPIRIKVSFDPPASAYGRKLPEITREAHRQAALMWHADILPRHFSAFAPFRYGYQPRTANYLKYKRRYAQIGRGGVQEGGQMALVYTGLLRDKIRARPGVHAYPTRTTLDLHAPSYATRRNYMKGGPNMAQELTALTADEVQAVEQVLGRVAEAGLKKIGDTRRVIVG